jgi:hypothetical protein
VTRASWQRFLEELAAEHGAEVKQTRNNHMVVEHPSGWRVFTASTPSDHRAKDNMRAQVRRAARGHAKFGQPIQRG